MSYQQHPFALEFILGYVSFALLLENILPDVVVISGFVLLAIYALGIAVDLTNQEQYHTYHSISTSKHEEHVQHTFIEKTLEENVEVAKTISQGVAVPEVGDEKIVEEEENATAPAEGEEVVEELDALAATVAKGLPRYFDNWRQIGQGAAGAVFDAYWPHSRGPVAAKLLCFGRQSNGGSLESTSDWVARIKAEQAGFEAEAALMGSSLFFGQNNVVEFVAHITLDGPDKTFRRQYMMLELATGTLQDTNLAAATAKEKLEVLRDMRNALVFLKTKEILHRDIKPANILRFPGPEGSNTTVYKVADFGVACRVAEIEEGAFAGTQDFMPPESYFDSQYSFAGDTWAAYVTWIEALGLLAGVEDRGLAYADRRDRVQEAWEGGMSDLVQPFRDMLATLPADRPTAEEVLRRVGAMLGQAERQGARKMARPVRRRVPAVAAAA